jgi:ribonuclease BN (tRNA processing enzyme)
MRVRVLGTRGEVEPSAPRHSRHSGLLVDGRLLLDLGEEEFLESKPRRVLITHLHPDHAFFVRKPAPLGRPVYAPEILAGRPEVKVFPGRMSFDGFTIRAVPTHHSLKVRSQAYLVRRGGRRMLYTGDLFWINKEYHSLFRGLDLVVTEASFIREGGMIRRDKSSREPYGHAGVPDLVRLFAPFTPTILFTHFGSWFYGDARKSRKTLAELGKQYGVSTIAGYDGYQLDIGKL